MKQIICTVLFIFLSTSVWAAGWTPNDPLMPTGDSTTDTANLQAALHDSRLDTGGTLYLGQGIFRIHRFVGRQDISDPSDPSYSTILFNGTIQGAGKGVTILRGVRGPGGVGFEPLHYEIPGFATDDHTLLGFIQTYLGVKDLTFDSEAVLVDPYNAYGNRGLVNFLGTGSFVLGLNELIGTDITNVHFKGSLDSNGHPETGHLFQQYGDAGGVHNVTNSEFENSSNGAIQVFELTGGTINIGGSPREKVTLTDNVDWGAIELDCAGCSVNVSHCDIRNSSQGVRFASYSPDTLATVVIAYNDMESVGNGVDVRDYPMTWGEGAVVDAVVAHNRINLNGSGPWWGGAIYSRFVKDAVIRSNQITGQVVSAAINIRGEGNLLTANNIQNVSSQEGMPPIWLWESSANNVVVGSGNLRVNVFDQGTNNIIIGME
jgi:hypothetical protein